MDGTHTARAQRGWLSYAADLLFQVGSWFCSRNDPRPLSKLSSMNVMPRLVIDDANRHRGEILSTYSVAQLVGAGFFGGSQSCFSLRSRSSSHQSPRARRSSISPADDTRPSLTYASLARPSPSRSPSDSSTSSVSASPGTYPPLRGVSRILAGL